MSFRVVRSSKFRHVFGKEEKRDNCYDGLKISRNAWDSPMCSVNTKFLAVILEAQGGGAFIVINLENTGRVDLNAPKVTGHQATVLDLQFCPFNDNMIASGSEDCLVKVWEIPEGGLTENLDESLVDLEGHQRRVGIVEWHPTAENVLLSAGFDYVIFIWDIAQAAAIHALEMHTDTIQCVSWNFDGSLLATTSKDKKLRVIDPRANSVIAEGKAHDGSKAQMCTFVGEENMIFTTGFSRMSERQYAVWDHKDISKPLKFENIDTSSGVLFPTYDPDTRMIYLAGKGDGNIRYYEIDPKKPFCHSLSVFSTSTPQRGVGWLPKTGCDLNACQVAKAYKLESKGSVTVIGFTVPRKSTLFQEDIFPPTKEPVAVLTAEEWAGGATKPPNKMSLKDNFVAVSRSSKASGGGASAKTVSYGAKKPTPAAAKPSAATTAARVNPYATKKAASGVNPYAKTAAAPDPEPAPVAAAPAPAAVAPKSPAAGEPPTSVEELTEAWHAHKGEIKAFKTKLATKEIEIARLKKEIAQLKG